MTKYRVTEVKSLNDSTRVFTVEWDVAAPWNKNLVVTDSADVWWYGKTGNCTNCSGPLTAMSASCAHVKSVKRHLSKAA